MNKFSNGSTRVDWSDDNVATLKRLWADGVSFTDIAKQIPGATRNCIAGKVHRLGLPSRKRVAKSRAA